MRMRLAGTLLVCGLLSRHAVRAQEVDPNLVQEVSAVRVEVARNSVGLREYTWTGLTEVSVKGDFKSSRAYKYRYDQSGQLVRKLAESGKEMEAANAVSKRPFNGTEPFAKTASTTPWPAST